MTLLALTYTRDAATGPMLMGGRAEAARPGGGSGMILPPPVCKFNRKTILLRCRRKAASHAAERLGFIRGRGFRVHTIVYNSSKY